MTSPQNKSSAKAIKSEEKEDKNRIDPANLKDVSYQHENLSQLINTTTLYSNEPIKRKYLGIITRRRVPAEDLPHREVFTTIPDTEAPDNKISTGKYNALTFLPKNLYEQFSKMANLYFLVIGALQIIKVISNSNGLPTIYMPLSVIVVISMIKDIFEDYKRHKSDNEENSKPVLVSRKGKWEEAMWRNLRIGDVVKISEDQYFPADILLLKTSEKQNACYIETKNLDGETNLKFKAAMKDVADEFPNENVNDCEDFYNKHLFSVYEKPNPYLYNFQGTIYVKNSEKCIALDAKNIILRGCSLKNSKWVIGMVLYSGFILLNMF